MTATVDELDPVRAELLRAARADAEAAVARARADAAQTLRAAHADAGRVLAQAREQGAGDGQAEAARERVRAAEDAWNRELAARAEVYADLGAAVRCGVRRALAEGAVPPGRLARTARGLLGENALITAPPGGGVVAEVPGRRLDLCADTLADRALEQLGARIERLWGEP